MKLTLVKKQDEAKDTKSFFFKSDDEFIFEAGQYLYITLPELHYPDDRGVTRHFTIASSPTEKDLIRITTRMREKSGYKKTLDELEIGSVVEGRGPQGFFTLNKNQKNDFHIFLAGGIGITPFRSIIKYVLDNNLNTSMHLIYSNSDSDFVFKTELDEWQDKNECLKIDYIDSSIKGHLDSNMLLPLIQNNLMENIYHVVGPNPFVDAIEGLLEESKIPGDNIKTEKFTGY